MCRCKEESLCVSAKPGRRDAMANSRMPYLMFLAIANCHGALPGEIFSSSSYRIPRDQQNRHREIAGERSPSSIQYGIEKAFLRSDRMT